MNACLLSWQKQIFQDFEILIRLDNPKKRNQFNKIQSSFSHNVNFKFYQNDKNLGIYQTQKRNIHCASGDFLLFQADDNLVNDDFLFEYSRIINETTKLPAILACSADIISIKEINDRVRNLNSNFPVYKTEHYTQAQIIALMPILKSALFAFDTVAIHRDRVKQHFNNQMKYSPAEDFTLIYNIIMNGGIVLISKKTCVFKIMKPNSYSKSNRSEMIRSTQLFLEEEIRPIGSISVGIAIGLNSSNIIRVILSSIFLIVAFPKAFTKLSRKVALKKIKEIIL